MTRGARMLLGITQPRAQRGGPPPTFPAPGAGTMKLGYNLFGFTGEGMPEAPFVNVWENARPWVGATITLDDEEYVTSIAEGPEYWAYSVVMTGDNPEWVGQELVVKWEGAGNLNISGADKVFSANRIEFTGQSGNATLQVQPAGSGAGQYPRNIVICRRDRETAYAGGMRFNPDFGTFLAPFDSLRTMDLQRSNADHPAIWANRSVPTKPRCREQYIDVNNPSAGTTDDGWCIEVIVAMANFYGKDLHLHIPLRADDAAVTSAVTLARTLLNPHLKLTVEYVNEPWNFQFPQTHHFLAIAVAEWGEEEGSGWIQAFGRRANQIAALARAVADTLGPSAGVIENTMNVQTGWVSLNGPSWQSAPGFAWLADAQLMCPLPVANATSVPCHTSIDSVALTCYTSGGLQYAPNWPTIQGWITELGLEGSYARAIQQLRFGTVTGLRNRDDTEDITEESAESLAKVRWQLEAQVTRATELGLSVCVYEMNSHFDDTAGTDHSNWLIGLRRSAGFGEYVSDWLDMLQELGVTTANWWGGLNDGQWEYSGSLGDTTGVRAWVEGWRAANPLT